MTLIEIKSVAIVFKSYCNEKLNVRFDLSDQLAIVGSGQNFIFESHQIIKIYDPLKIRFLLLGQQKALNMTSPNYIHHLLIRFFVVARNDENNIFTLAGASKWREKMKICVRCMLYRLAF